MVTPMHRDDPGPSGWFCDPGPSGWFCEESR
jgi:hypothetical protein